MLLSTHPEEPGHCCQKAQTHRRTTSCVYLDHTAHSERQLLCCTLPASSSLHFPFASQTPEQGLVSDVDLSQMGADVFQLAPFKKTPARENKLILNSLPSEPSDVFLQAPFVRRQNPQSAPEFPLRPPEARVLQQPMSVHRVVSRVGQQAAVSSVAVGPLHAWTIAGRPTDDPFTAAPFSPRCSQERL